MEISARKAAHVRKEAILTGIYSSFDPLTGQGWDPSWEELRSIPRIRAPKLHKRECTREALMQKIENLLETMDEKIAEHQQVVLDHNCEGGILNVLDQMFKKKKK